MAVTRVSTYGIYQTTVGNSLKVQSGIADTQIQISSGLKSQNFSGLNGQVEQFTAVENKLSKADLYLKNNALVQSRIRTADTAISQVIDIVSNLKNLIIQRRNATTAEQMGFEQQVDAAFRALAGQLNANSEGRYLFGGARTDTPPVKETFPQPVQPGVPDTGYYQGSDQDIYSRIEDNFEIAYNVRADDEGFQKVMAGLASAMEGGAENNDSKLSQAYDLLQEGLDRIITVQANLNTSGSIIDKANERHTAQQIYLKGLKEEITQSDVVGLSIKLAADQSVLQASFSAFARIISLKLSDYLR